MHMKINIFILVSLCLGLNLDSKESYVMYQGSHPAHSWEGTSKEMVSSLSCSDTNAKQGCVLDIEIPIESFDSKNTSRDSNMFYYTESLKYPKVHFKSKPFDMNYSDITTINGSLTFHGITKELSIGANIVENDGGLIGDTIFEIILSEHDVKRPSLLFIKISDIIVLQAHLEFLQ